MGQRTRSTPGRAEAESCGDEGRGPGARGGAEAVWVEPEAVGGAGGRGRGLVLLKFGADARNGAD